MLLDPTRPNAPGTEDAFCDALPSGAAMLPGIAGEADRRTFLKAVGAVSCLTACTAVLGRPATALGSASPEEVDWRFVAEARFYEKLPDKQVRCKLCPRECVVAEGARGYCGVRENRRGTYYTLVHSRVAAAHVDPVEKKPFFHFRPGSLALSIATGGCNVNCKFCQNWELSQARPEQLRALYLPPRELAATAKENRCPLLAYTYSEPIVFSEYVVDAAEAGHALGIQSVVVSNGFIQQQPLKRLCAAVDAIKIDVKAFSESYYREVVRGELRPVLDTVLAIRKHGRWLELVYLVVPTLNDSDTEFRALARWVKSELGPEVPLHFSRFRPLYLLKHLPPTPLETLERAKAICDAEGLHFVYVGNVPGHVGQTTPCPKCRRPLIERVGFTVTQMRLRKGKCEYCGQAIAGVWA